MILLVLIAHPSPLEERNLVTLPVSVSGHAKHVYQGYKNDSGRALDLRNLRWETQRGEAMEYPNIFSKASI